MASSNTKISTEERKAKCYYESNSNLRERGEPMITSESPKLSYNFIRLSLKDRPILKSSS